LALAAARPPAEVEVTMSVSGLKPAELTVRKGETLRLRVRSLDREHCFALDAFRVEKRVLPQRPTIVDIVADRVGTFPIHSCLEPDNPSLRGRLVVSE
jgi:heme/copper-type cytochrome/quinol oxidase subunit 2